MTLGQRRKHEPCVAMDGKNCISCGQDPNDYSYHLRLLGFIDNELVWEGMCPKYTPRFKGDTGDHSWGGKDSRVCIKCGVEWR